MTTLPPANAEKITAQELRAAFKLLDERIAWLINAYKLTVEKLDQLEADLLAVREGLASAASRPAAIPQAGSQPGETTVIDCNVITVSYDDNGQVVYKARGGQYSKFGVRIWPEVIGQLVTDVTQLKPGPNAVDLKLRVLLGETGQPRKVIGLA
jgi:hypothetical protein